MRLSLAGLENIEHWEGLKLRAYYDSGGVLTIGYGHTGPDVTPGLVWSQQQANAALWRDTQKAQDSVNILLGDKVVVTQDQFDALVDFEFNTGALAKSTLLKKLYAADFDGAAEEFDKWDKVKGGVVLGLLSRREAETAMFRKDLTVA